MAIEVVSFREYKKNTLQGFLNLRLTTIKLQINGVCLHEKNGKRWLSLPARPYEKKEGGGTAWAIMLEFYDRSAQERFQEMALQALAMYLQGQ
jgi:hypothetical protein